MDDLKKEQTAQPEFLFTEDDTIDRTVRKGFRYFVKCALKSKSAVFGFTVLFLLILCAIFAPVLAPHDPEAVDLSLYLMPPAWMEGGSISYPLGTDSLGRCILSRIIYGSRISLIVGFASVAISGAIGVILGLLAGYFGKLVDDIIMRIADVIFAFPFVLLAIAVLSVIGSGVANVVAVLVVSSWVTYARMVRGEVISTREKEYVEAAKAIGLPARTIIFKHIMPNIINSVIVIASFSFASSILSEASLSFLGLGVPAATPTWGGMISLARNYIYDAWWMCVFPGIAIALTVLGINILGDWLRDYLDPKIQNY